jgi:hypothetical protein
MGFVGENKTLRGAGPYKIRQYHANCEWVFTTKVSLVSLWYQTISEEALGTVVGLTTSLDVWKARSNAYSQDS